MKTMRCFGSARGRTATVAGIAAWMLLCVSGAARADDCVEINPIGDQRAHTDFLFEKRNIGYTRLCAEPALVWHFWYLDQAPPGMTINGPGSLITWTPTRAQIGVHTVTVRVVLRNFAGGAIVGEDTDTFTVTVDDNTMTYPVWRDYRTEPSAIAVTGRAGGAGFASYRLEYRPTSSQAWLPITGPAAVPVPEEGPLGTWDVSALPDGGRYVLRLAVTDAGGAESTLENQVILDRTLKPGWSQRSPQPILSNVTPADLDDDGICEIVALNGRDITCWNIDGTKRWGGPLPVDVWTNASPSVGDVTGDGVPEILYTTSKFLVAQTPTGAMVPGFPIRPSPTEYTRMAPTLADLDGDGVLDILVATYNSQTQSPAELQAYRYVAASQSLQMLPGWPQPVSSYITFASPSVADLDGDGGPDVVFALTDRCYAWRADGTSLPGWAGGAVLPRAVSGGWANGGAVGLTSPSSQPAIADLDGDGIPEIAVGSNVLRTDGTPKAGWTLGQSGTGVLASLSPAIGDVDGEPGLEVVLGRFAFHADGSLVQGFPFVPPAGIPDLTASILARCQGTDSCTVLAGTRTFGGGGTGIVAYHHDHLNGNGVEMLPGYPKSLYGETGDVAAPVAGDFDGDGLIDVAVAITDPTYGSVVAVYDMPFDNQDEYHAWPMMGHDLRRSGRYTVPRPNRPTGLTAAAGEGGAVALGWTDNSGVEQATVVERSATGAAWTYAEIGRAAADETSYADAPGAGTWHYRVRGVRTDPTWGEEVLSVASTAAVATVQIPALATVVVTPGAATVESYATQAFAAQGYDQFGAPFAAAFSWSATGGTVTPSGTYTAPLAEGVYEVTASSGGVSGSATVTVVRAPSVLTSVTVTPSTVTLGPVAQQQFSAQALDQYGDPIAASLTWTATGGTVSSSGFYTAPASFGGPFTVTAASGAVSGTATVEMEPRRVASLAVSPASVMLLTGAQQQFAAQGTDQYGQPIAAAVTWSTSYNYGSITADGLHTSVSVAATYPITATSGTVSATASVTTVAPLSIYYPLSMPNAQRGASYPNGVIYSQGGSGGLQWSISQGALPPGLSLAPSGSSAARISGTPTQTGTYSFTLRVSDSMGNVATRAYTLTVLEIEITTVGLNPLTLNGSFYQLIISRGGSGGNQWSVVSGALPAGIALTPASGVLSGTPTAAGAYGFTLRVTDSAGHTDTQAYAGTVAGVSITGLSPSSGYVGSAYSGILSASGGTGQGYVWSLVGGAFPPGLTLNANGTVTGIPTKTGLFSFTVGAVDSGGNQGSRSLSLWISGSMSAE